MDLGSCGGVLSNGFLIHILRPDLPVSVCTGVCLLYLFILFHCVSLPMSSWVQFSWERDGTCHNAREYATVYTYRGIYIFIHIYSQIGGRTGIQPPHHRHTTRPGVHFTGHLSAVFHPYCYRFARYHPRPAVYPCHPYHSLLPLYFSSVLYWCD